MEILLALVIVILCVAGLGLGYLVSGKRLKGSCGGFAIRTKEGEVRCGVCGKEGDEIETCDSEENPTEESHSTT